MATEEDAIRLYRADWITSEGVPWLLVAVWQAGGQIGAQWSLFLTDGPREGDGLIDSQVVRTRIESAEIVAGVNLSVTPAAFLETVRDLGNARLRIWLDERYLATKSGAYLRSIELIPVNAGQLVSLALSRKNKKLLAQIGERTSASTTLRELLRRLVEEVPELKVARDEF